MRRFITDMAEDRRGGIQYLPVLVLLRIFSWIYGALAGLYAVLFDLGFKPARRLGAPVISVGNLTWGGTGKTPLVIWMAQLLKRENLKAAVLTRGYMINASVKSDEAALLTKKMEGMPVIVGKNRFESGTQFLKKNTVDVFLLDDGFQHRGIARDLNVVVVDARRPFGNGALIPRGSLREPLTALKRADVVVLTRTDQASDIDKILERIRLFNSRALLVNSIHQPTALVPVGDGTTIDPSWLKGKRIVIFSGIGQPDSFKALLERFGTQVAKVITFADHHMYRTDEIDGILRDATALNADAVITTMKDAVKIDAIGVRSDQRVKFYYLDIELTITEGKDEFIQRILHTVRR